MAVTDIGIDLGTSSVLVFVKGKGIVLGEPSLVAYDRDAGKIRAIGEEARLMLSRAAGSVVEIRPVQRGIISDYMVTEQMLRYFIQKATGRLSFRKPRVSITVPWNVTPVQRRAVEDAAFQAGAREVVLLPEPIVSAIGAGMDITRPNGNMIVNVGAGITSVSVLSINGVAVNQTIRVGGDDLDEDIVRHVKERYGLMISKQAAEEIKVNIGTAFERPEMVTMDVTGRDMSTGLPKTARITSEDTREAMKDTVAQILDAIHSVLERMSPELAVDIVQRGIVLVGAGALLGGLEELIEARTGINTITADEAPVAVVKGAGLYDSVMEESLGRYDE